jgi:hypothetical protein
MSKTFFIYTGIIEALTGLGLQTLPANVARVLLGAELQGALEIVLAMAAGAAILSIAFLSWLSGKGSGIPISLMVLLMYNFLISVILIYAGLGLGFKGIPLWVTIIFHLFQSAQCVILLKRQRMRRTVS